MSADWHFKIEVVVHGEATEIEYSYGKRVERPVLARLDVEVDPALSWQIFKDATTAATAGQCVEASADV